MMDHVLNFMKKQGIPLTRENYLAIDRPGVDQRKYIGAEAEAELPEQFQIGFEGWVN